MPDAKPAVRGREALTVLAVGSGLWLFLRLSGLLLGTLAQGVPLLLEIGMAISLAGVLLLIHRMENTRRMRRAVGVGAVLAVAPVAAVLGAGDSAGVPGLAAARSAVLALGVIAASVAVFRLGRTEPR